MKEFILVLTVFILCVTAGAETAAGGDDKAVSEFALQEVLAMALSGNPGLAQMRARFEAKSAIPSQVGTLPDPTLSLNALNYPTDTFRSGQEAMTQIQLGISQKFPFPGKLALREQASSYEANAARNDVNEARLNLMRDVRSSWWTLHYLDQALAIVAKNQDLLRQFVEIAKVKYEVGDGMQQDVLLAQLELSKLLENRIQLNGFRRGEVARLNSLLNRPANMPIAVVAIRNKTLPELDDEELLYERAMESRPELARSRNRIKAAESRLGLAKKDYYPDFTLGAHYGFRQGENPQPRSGDRADFLSLRLSVNLPLYPRRKRASAVSQRSSEVQQEQYSLQDRRGAVQSEISQAVAAYTQAKEEFSLFDTGIIPQSQQTVQSMLAAYQVNEVDFLNLVRSQITLFNFETQYWRAFSAANQALAKLSAAVGEENIYE